MVMLAKDTPPKVVRMVDKALSGQKLVGGLRVMIGFIRNAKTGELDQIRTAPFQPGMIITRLGKKYSVDEHGTQRRIKD